MCRYKEKITYQKTRKQFKEIKQIPKPDMVEMLELSDCEFKTTMINMLRTVMDRIDSM